MTPLKAVTLTTPDGVSRELRDTPGARKRIFEKFGEPNFIEIAKVRGDWALFEVAYLMMYDRRGDPPAGLTLEQFMEDASTSSRTELLAAIIAAVSNGEKSKNDLEALLKEAEETSTGLTSGPSLPSASDSPIPSSGGATPGLSLPPEPSDTTSESA